MLHTHSYTSWCVCMHLYGSSSRLPQSTRNAVHRSMDPMPLLQCSVLLMRRQFMVPAWGWTNYLFLGASASASIKCITKAIHSFQLIFFWCDVHVCASWSSTFRFWERFSSFCFWRVQAASLHHGSSEMRRVAPPPWWQQLHQPCCTRKQGAAACRHLQRFQRQRLHCWGANIWQ